MEAKQKPGTDTSRCAEEPFIRHNGSNMTACNNEGLFPQQQHVPTTKVQFCKGIPSLLFKVGMRIMQLPRHG